MQPQVLEILGHVNKRVRAARGMRLPLLPLAKLGTGAGHPMVRSFGLVYTEMAVEQAPPEELTQAVGVRIHFSVCVVCVCVYVCVQVPLFMCMLQGLRAQEAWSVEQLHTWRHRIQA